MKITLEDILAAKDEMFTTQTVPATVQLPPPKDWNELKMRNSIDQMIDLAKVFSSNITLTKDVSEAYLVEIQRVSWKENKHDIMARSLFATGGSVEEACENYLNLARGKLLFGNDKSYYGESRPEYLCV